MEERITTAGIAVRYGMVFVAHREKGGSLSGKWEFPGGKQRWGESDEDTLRREYMEELGAQISVGDLLAAFDFENNGTLYHLRAHFVSFITEPMKLEVHTESGWVSLEELRALEMGESDSRIRDFLLHSLE